MKTRRLSLLCVLLVIFWLSPARDAAPAGSIADVTPADTLLYAEIAQPAGLWASVQETELRDAVKSSFAAELILSFVSSTADLFCKTLTDRSIGEAVERYGITIGVVSAPAAPSADPDIIVILQASSHTEELKRLLAGRVEKTLKARFPEVEITQAKIGEEDVIHIAFSRKRVWTLAFTGSCVAYGRRRAANWLLTGGARLAERPNYKAALEKVKRPAGPHIFCYAETTGAASKFARFYGEGTVMSGVLEVRGQAPRRLVHDRILLSGNVQPPRLGPAQPCRIGAVFPRGPWLVNQISFASGGDMRGYLPIRRHARAGGAAFGRAFTGLGFLALTVETKNWLGVIAAAEVAERDAVEAWLQASGFKNQAGAWCKDQSTAVINNGYFYIGRAPVMVPLIRSLTSEKGAMLEDQGDYAGRLKALPGKAHGYSVMTSQFLLGPGCDKELLKFHEVLTGLSPSLARAENTADGIEITSVSPCGYGIWLVSINLATD